MNLNDYEAAAEKQREANALAGKALAPYWDRLIEWAESEDPGQAISEGILCVESDGEITLAIGGPGVWLMPNGTMAGAWWGPRVYAEAPSARAEDAANLVIEYCRAEEPEGVVGF